MWVDPFEVAGSKGFSHFDGDRCEKLLKDGDVITCYHLIIACYLQ